MGNLFYSAESRVKKYKSTSELQSENLILKRVKSRGISSFVQLTENQFIFSIFYFASSKHQRTFYRLMIVLAVVDTVFLLSSCLTFSLPKLSKSYHEQYWAYLLPYTLPIAQVILKQGFLIITTYWLLVQLNNFEKLD